MEIANKSILKKALAAAICIIVFFSAIVVKADIDPNASYPVDNDSWQDWPAADAIYGKTAILMDIDTGTILYSKGADAQRYPASITKVMTALLVAENVSMEDRLIMSEASLADAYDGSSNIHPVVGESFSIYEALEMLLVKSANDVATELAIKVSGSVEAFADLMNYRAAELGCTNTHFTNANGLEDPAHYTSAMDMALIMRMAIQYPVLTEIMSLNSVVIPATEFSEGRMYYNHNYLIDPSSDYYYPSCLGGKTGYTDEARSTLVCYASRDGMNLIGVVMGAPESGTNASDMIQLFEYGFNNFYHVNPFEGIPGAEGTALTIPNHLSADNIQHTDTVADGTAVITFSLGDHAINTFSVPEDTYNSFLIARGEYQPETDNNTESVIGSESASLNYEAIKVPEHVNDSHVKIVLYIIIIVLIAAIILCIVIIKNKRKADRIRQKKKSNKSKNNRQEISK